MREAARMIARGWPGGPIPIVESATTPEECDICGFSTLEVGPISPGGTMSLPAWGVNRDALYLDFIALEPKRVPPGLLRRFGNLVRRLLGRAPVVAYTDELPEDPTVAVAIVERVTKAPNVKVVVRNIAVFPIHVFGKLYCKPEEAP